MIDWYFVFVSSLWILGLSIILAAFSWLDWWSKETRTRRRELFKRPMWRVPANGGMVLVCLGFGLGRDVAWWERTLWALLFASFAWSFIVAAREMREESRTRQPRD
jgi:hypothetical protein